MPIVSLDFKEPIESLDFKEPIGNPRKKNVGHLITHSIEIFGFGRMT